MRATLPVLLAAAVVGVAAAALAGVAGPRGGGWQRSRVPVWDFTAAEWQPVVAGAVAGFNAAMPPEVPRLVHRPMHRARPCADLPRRGRMGGITVCLVPTSADIGGYGGIAYWGRTGEPIVQAKISLTAEMAEAHRSQALCHELMHAATGMPDRTSGPGRDETSCVHGGVLTAPGADDAAYAAEVYAWRVRRHGD